MTLEIFEIVLISTIAFLIMLAVTVIATQYKKRWYFCCYLITNSAPRRVFVFPRRGVFYALTHWVSRTYGRGPTPAPKSLTVKHLARFFVKLNRKKKVKKKWKKVTFMLAIFRDCAILFPVMRDRIELEEVFVSEESPVLVSCCGCGNEEHISQEEADQWTDTDWFQCHECE